MCKKTLISVKITHMSHSLNYFVNIRFRISGLLQKHLSAIRLINVQNIDDENFLFQNLT